MRKRVPLVLTLALAVAVIGTALTYAGARGFRNGGQRPLRGPGGFPPPLPGLTEEQQTELQQLIERLKADKASWKDIRAAVHEQLKAWGIELPEKRGPFANLTEEQQTAIQEKVKEMEEAGASRKEIREAVRDMLEGWDIDLLESPGTKIVSKTAPTSASVHQNVPNPFNPTTTIAYDLSEPSNVTLRVYTITGQEVATLVSDYQQPGHYEVVWDGSRFANGVYVYRFEAGQFTETKRMLLLK